MRTALIAILAIALCACEKQTRGETESEGRLTVPKTLSELFQAIEREDLKQVQACIKEHPELVKKSNESATTPLHRAANYSTDPEIAKALLKNGADVNAKNIQGLTPLHCAILAGNSAAVIAELINAKADVNERETGGGTPLHMATFQKSPDIIKILLRAGANVGNKNSEGESVLAYAVSLGKTEGSEIAVQAFVDAGIDINVPSITGDPLLHYAITMRFANMVPVLISGGADMTSKDLNGRTPLQLARESGDAEIIEALRKKY